MFKNIKFILILTILCSSSLVVKAQEKLELSLEDALQIALSDNPLIKIADKEVEKSEYEKRGTYAALYPTVTADASYQRTVKKQTMYMDFGGEVQKIEMGMSNSFSGGFTAAMPLVNFALWESLKISASSVELAIESARGSKVSMIEQVSKAFYGVLLAQETYNVYKEVHENALANYKNVKQKFDVGSTSEYELIRADVAVKNNEPNLYNAEHAITLALWQLKALLGLDLEMLIGCKGSLDDYAGDMVWRRAEIRLEQNSSIKQLNIQNNMLVSTLEMQKKNNYPTLSASFSYNWSALDNTLKFSSYNWNPYGVIGLSLSVPIFQGGQRRMEIKKAKVDIDNLALQRENTIKNLEVSWLQYDNAMDVSVHQYDLAKSTINEAQKGYDIAVGRYEVGKGTQLEINDSQLQLVQAQHTKNTAIYDYLSSKASLEALSGGNY
ncbi:MAG: TolC family protein [Rikenellaceae bacterium]